MVTLGLGVGVVVEDAEDACEEGEGGAGGEDALPDGLARKVLHVQLSPVFGMVCISHRAGEQASLRNDKCNPAVFKRQWRHAPNKLLVSDSSASKSFATN